MDTFEHITHCFDVLRQDILCAADDTPLYTIEGEQNVLGEGQPRKCRDFKKLEKWAKSNEACYAYVKEVEPFGPMDRYQYCSKDSKFGPNMRAYFGYPDDWYEEPVEKVPPY